MTCFDNFEESQCSGECAWTNTNSCNGENGGTSGSGSFGATSAGSGSDAFGSTSAGSGGGGGGSSGMFSAGSGTISAGTSAGSGTSDGGSGNGDDCGRICPIGTEGTSACTAEQLVACDALDGCVAQQTTSCADLCQAAIDEIACSAADSACTFSGGVCSRGEDGDDCWGAFEQSVCDAIPACGWRFDTTCAYDFTGGGGGGGSGDSGGGGGGGYNRCSDYTYGRNLSAHLLCNAAEGCQWSGTTLAPCNEREDRQACLSMSSNSTDVSDSESDYDCQWIGANAVQGQCDTCNNQCQAEKAACNMNSARLFRQGCDQARCAITAFVEGGGGSSDSSGTGGTGGGTGGPAEELQCRHLQCFERIISDFYGGGGGGGGGSGGSGGSFGSGGFGSGGTTGNENEESEQELHCVLNSSCAFIEGQFTSICYATADGRPECDTIVDQQICASEQGRCSTCWDGRCYTLSPEGPRCPSLSPSMAPTTSEPTASQTAAPATSNPTLSPTVAPSTSDPSMSPTAAPSTSDPTATPTAIPTATPPANAPTDPTPRPTRATRAPVSSRPTRAPATSVPSGMTSGGGSDGAAGAAEKPSEDDGDDDMLPVIAIAGGALFLIVVLLCIVTQRKKKKPNARAAKQGKGKGKTAPDLVAYEAGPPAPARAKAGPAPVRATAAPGFGRAIANPMFQAPQQPAAPTYAATFSASNEFDA